jgi:hypothetical protein
MMYQLNDVFSEIRRRHAAMTALEDFAKDKPRVARAAEGIRECLEPVRDRNDRWTTNPDGSSQPGLAVDRRSLRDDVRKLIGKAFDKAAFDDACTLCTVNDRGRTQYYDVWRALQDLVPAAYRYSDRAHYIRHYFDLLYATKSGALRTALTRADPQFRLYKDPETETVYLGQLLDGRAQVDYHYHYLAVYGEEPAYVRLDDGKYLYFDSPEILGH